MLGSARVITMAQVVLAPSHISPHVHFFDFTYITHDVAHHFGLAAVTHRKICREHQHMVARSSCILLTIGRPTTSWQECKFGG